MSRENVGKSFIVNTDDLDAIEGGTGSVTMEQVNQAIATALTTYAKSADVYTKAEADAKFQPKA